MKPYAMVFAADLPSSEKVLEVVRQVASVIEGVKVAAATVLESGVGIISRIRDLMGDKPVLVDLKIADIGFNAGGKWDGTNGKIIRGLADSGATHVTVHGFPGPLSVAEAAATARECGMEVLLIPLMSHAGGGLFFERPVDPRELVADVASAGLIQALPETTPCRDVTDAVILLGEALDVGGYIGPATRPADLRRYRSLTSKPIWCPGFGRQDRLGRSLLEQFHEWAAIVGPQSAAIVGSAIFKADDPAAATEEIVSLRDRAVNER
ncbi:MAG: orotidine 5'-phosphate decarboxylase [Desulfomonile sp.]|nr:orotidine 5'-phosphate decarboxylase [Desulfomonile sp.]